MLDVWNKIKFKLGFGYTIEVSTVMALIIRPGQYSYAGLRYDHHPQLTCWLHDNGITKYNIHVKYSHPFYSQPPAEKVKYTGVVFKFLNPADAIVFKMRWL